MSHPIIMTWINNSEDTFTFTNQQVQEGTIPDPGSTTLPPQGSVSVHADQKHNLSPGPEGSYDWINTVDEKKNINCYYKHPAGTGETSVTDTCSNGYKVSSDGATYFQAHTFTDASLQHHDADITMYIKSE